MAVNMEPSVRYIQINTIPCSTAYAPQIKKGLALNEKTMDGSKQNRILTWDQRKLIQHITDNAKGKFKKKEIYPRGD
jgi:hypothetical protein